MNALELDGKFAGACRRALFKQGVLHSVSDERACPDFVVFIPNHEADFVVFMSAYEGLVLRECVGARRQVCRGLQGVPYSSVWCFVNALELDGKYAGACKACLIQVYSAS